MIPYSRIASGGVTFTVKSPGRASRMVEPAGGAPRSGAIRSRAFTSHTRTRFPDAGGEDARAADTVDFPTPPLPVTTTSLRSSKGRGGHEA